jgi:hypothetical protein
MMSPSLESFFGNPEFRSMVTRILQEEPSADGAPRVRVLLLDPDASVAARLERLEREEAPVLGTLRDRIRATLAHAVDIVSALPAGARDRFAVRVSDAAPLWRFRMIFLPECRERSLHEPARCVRSAVGGFRKRKRRRRQTNPLNLVISAFGGIRPFPLDSPRCRGRMPPHLPDVAMRRYAGGWPGGLEMGRSARATGTFFAPVGTHKNTPFQPGDLMGLAFRSGIFPERGRAFFLLAAGGEGTSLNHISFAMEA